MKRTKWIFAILAILVAATGFATEIPKMEIVPVEAEKALVAFQAVTPSPLEITITRENGEILYYRKSETPLQNYQTVFDFSTAGKGLYTVCINYCTRSLTRNIEVKKDNIVVGPSVQMYEPYFCFEEDMLSVSFLNIATKGVWLNIYKDGEYVDGSSLGRDLTIQKVFDFSRLEKGEYEVVLSDLYKDHTFIVRK